MDSMFNPQAIASGMLAMAPSFILNSFDCVIVGVIAAYSVLLLFLGGPSGFFLRLLQLMVTVAGSYGAARALRFLLRRGDAIIMGSPGDAAGSPAAAATASPAEGAAADKSSRGKSTAKASSKLHASGESSAYKAD